MASVRILVVDDEPKISQSLCQVLNAAGFLCSEANGYQDAVELFQANFFDIVIIDYWLPKKTGLQLAAKLKELKPFTRIVLMSGMIDDERHPAGELQAEARALALADRYLGKPIEMARLIEIVRELSSDLASKQGDWKAKAQEAIDRASVDKSKVGDLDKKLAASVRSGRGKKRK